MYPFSEAKFSTTTTSTPKQIDNSAKLILGNMVYRRERLKNLAKNLYQKNQDLKKEIERINIKLNNTKIFADEKENLRIEQIQKLENDLEETRQDYYEKLIENGELDRELRVAKGRVEALTGENLKLTRNMTDFRSSMNSYSRERQIKELELKRLLMTCEENSISREKELNSWKLRNERFEQNNRDLINQNKLIRDQIIATTDELDRCRQKEKLFERNCNCESFRIQANSCQPPSLPKSSNRIRQQAEREITSLQRQLKIYQNQDRQRRNETERVATEFHQFKIKYHEIETNLIMDDVLKCRAMLEALKKQSALRIRSVEFEAKTWRTKHTEESDRNTQLQYEKNICDERLLGKTSDLNATEFEKDRLQDDLYKCQDDRDYADKTFAIKESDLRHEISVVSEKYNKEADQRERLSRKLSQQRKRIQNLSAACNGKDQDDLRSCPICEEKLPSQTEPIPAKVELEKISIDMEQATKDEKSLVPETSP
ncbi:Oidioi.mRNA.OKI2018_I69.PAR.g9020.t1.cds [Oikopleura dioica]|uniref:Oidioi.mRNA.OKI2018_I69.PAR.g9020.t1.cds n=1 Tax=Oikopleura dioica TaxID=34765 RepID=A0ABN7RM95_OIKDI|nr:Oidioi.mRNA.OKI2018_I69.PAR.g9020.t1.cds [Oikopleura dioica]